MISLSCVAFFSSPRRKKQPDSPWFPFFVAFLLFYLKLFQPFTLYIVTKNSQKVKYSFLIFDITFIYISFLFYSFVIYYNYQVCENCFLFWSCTSGKMKITPLRGALPPSTPHLHLGNEGNHIFPGCLANKTLTRAPRKWKKSHHSGVPYRHQRHTCTSEMQEIKPFRGVLPPNHSHLHLGNKKSQTTLGCLAAKTLTRAPRK